jgi:hypothetical protein
MVKAHGAALKNGGKMHLFSFLPWMEASSASPPKMPIAMYMAVAPAIAVTTVRLTLTPSFVLMDE